MDELVEAIGEAWVLYSHNESLVYQRYTSGTPAVATQSMQVLVPADC